MVKRVQSGAKDQTQLVCNVLKNGGKLNSKEHCQQFYQNISSNEATRLTNQNCKNPNEQSSHC